MEKTPENHGKNWTSSDVAALKVLLERGVPIEEIAKRFKRTPYAIECKAKSLKFDPPIGEYTSADIAWMNRFGPKDIGTPFKDDRGDTWTFVGEGWTKDTVVSFKMPLEMQAYTEDRVLSKREEKEMYEMKEFVNAQDVSKMDEDTILRTLRLVKEREDYILDSAGDKAVYTVTVQQKIKKAREVLMRELNTRFV